MIFVGSGGHSTDLAAIAHRCGESQIRYIEEHDPEALRDQLAHGSRYVLAMNSSRDRERLDVGDRPASYFDPTATLSSQVFSPGVIVGQNTTIGPAVTLGRHTHINGNVFITRASLGDYCTVAPGVTICGDVTIGAGCSIGAGATISNLVTIGPRVTIGAGAVVLPGTEIPPNSTWVGVPARRLTSADYKTAVPR